MMNLTVKESMEYRGGAISASLISAVGNAAKIIYSIGQNLGSTIKRWISGTSC